MQTAGLICERLSHWELTSVQREGNRREEQAAQSSDTAAFAATWKRQAGPWELKEDWTSVYVPVRSCVEWSVKDRDAESQLCSRHPGTPVMLRGALPPDPLGNTTRSLDGLIRQTQSSLFDWWIINWNNSVGGEALVFHMRWHITSVLLVLHRFSKCCHSPGANLQAE